MRRRRKATRLRRVKLTGSELATLVALVSTLEPEIYAEDSVKSLVYRCKAVINDPPVALTTDGVVIQ